MKIRGIVLMVMLAGVLQLAGCGAGGDSTETEDGKGNTYATASCFAMRISGNRPPGRLRRNHHRRYHEKDRTGAGYYGTAPECGCPVKSDAVE